MEYEIKDEPQGERDQPEGDRDGGIADEHSSLQNQSVVTPNDYPADYREQQAIATGKKPKKP